MLGAVASISSKFLLGIAAATISTIIASVVVVEVMNTLGPVCLNVRQMNFKLTRFVVLVIQLVLNASDRV